MKKALNRCLVALLLCTLPIQSLAGGTVEESKGSPREQASTPAASGSIEAIDISMEDATSVTVRWEAANCPATVYYSVEGRELYYYIEADASPVTIYNLAPQTVYEIIVVDENTGVDFMRMVEMPDPGPYREHGYRWNLCNTYFVEDGDKSVTERRRLRSNNLTVQELEDNLQAGIYVMILEASWNKTKEEKAWSELWLMRTPGGDVYTIDDVNTCDPEWTSIYFFYPLGSLMEEYLYDRDEWELGEYQFELYFDGQFAGRAKLTLKE